MTGSWRAALRLARREVWRAKGRSALVAAMVGVPVLLITAMVVLAGTVRDAGSEESSLLRQLGAADARITEVGRTPLVQDHLGRTQPDRNAGEASGGQAWTAREIADATGGRVVPVREGGILIRTGAGALSARVRELDVRDPVIEGLARVTGGRPPETTGEVLVSTALADRGFGPGRTVDLVGSGGGPTAVTVVGIVRNPAALKDSEIVGLPGSVLGDDAEPAYLVDTGGAAVSWSKVRELNALGLGVVSRVVLGDPPAAEELPAQLRATTSGSGSAAGAMLAGLLVACIVLEVALLAGPAFVVGARRQRRQLALVAAVGGTPADVRRVVLAQGLVLGFGAAVVGAAVAITAILAGRTVIDSLVGAEIGPPRVHPLDLLVIIGVATFAAFAAAIVPALQASRQDTVAALAGRPGSIRSRRGWPLLGLLLVAGGLGLALVGMGAASGGEMPIVLGTFAVVAGVIMVTPALLGVVGRLGARLPLSLRLAARDTARHRSRTASVVSAIMGTVIGVTALAIASSSDFAEQRRDYLPQQPMGSLTISFAEDFGSGPAGIADATAEAVVDRVEALLPGRTATVAHGGGGLIGERDYQNVDLLIPDCQPTDQTHCVWSQSLRGLTGYGLPMLVAEADTVERLVGRGLTAEQRETLERGGVLVPDQATLAADGTARVQTGSARQLTQTTLPGTALPELAVRDGGSVRLVAGLAATRSTAERLGLTVAPHQIVVPPGEPEIGEEQQARIEELVQGLAPGVGVYVERGFVESYTPIWWILAGLGGLIVLLGTATGTALAMADARPDFASLAAVGAAPWLRRRQAMAQAGLIGFLGAVLGVAIGAVPGLAATWPLTAASTDPAAGGHIVDIPWTLLGLVVLAVPLLAVAGAGALTRTRLPLVQRIE